MTEFELKPLSPNAIGAAFEKMQQYRLLNEPDQAESICRDILHVDPDLRDARIGLLLCLTDQFGRRLLARWAECVAIVEGLSSDYDRAYYRGIISERRAKAHHARRSPQSGYMAHTWLCEAMRWYEAAEPHRAEGDDDCLLRWNSCARMIMRHADIRPETGDDEGPALLE